jgi:SAM-dependent methyltransferase
MDKFDFIIRERCPVCNSADSKTLYFCEYEKSPVKEYLVKYYQPHGEIEFEYLRGASYILEECRDCGLIFQKQVPNDALSIKLYEEWIIPSKNLDYHETVDDLPYYSAFANELMMIIASFKKVPSQLRLLDFGMGWGKWARMATAFGCDCYGTEISRSRIDYAKLYGIKVIDLSAEYFGFFDFINVDQVLEHVREPREIIASFKKFLKSGGLLRISVPDGWDIKKRLAIMDWNAQRWTSNSLHKVSPLEHINCFNNSVLMEMASRAGYEFIDMPKKLKLLSCAYDLPYGFSLSRKDILKYRYRYYSFTRGTNLFFKPKIP